MHTTGRDAYSSLLTAVQDLLCELRITPRNLAAMAKGQAPTYPGGFHYDTKACCAVQLSQVVAEKLINAGVSTKEWD